MMYLKVFIENEKLSDYIDNLLENIRGCGYCQCSGGGRNILPLPSIENKCMACYFL